MKNREHILNCLESHILEKYRGPFIYRMKWVSREYFAQKSYEKWAANEFLSYLKNELIDPYNAAENFIKMVNDFACSKSETSFIFLIAREVAEDLLDFMNALK